MQIKRATYRHIEAEIYAYHDTLRAIDDLRLEILYSGSGELPYEIHNSCNRKAVEHAIKQISSAE